MQCPTCGSTNVEFRAKRYTLYPLGIVAIFGVGLATLHQLSAPMDYRCAKCGLDFGRRTAIARVAGAILIVLIALTALGYTGLILRMIATLGR